MRLVEEDFESWGLWEAEECDLLGVAFERVRSSDVGLEVETFVEGEELADHFGICGLGDDEEISRVLLTCD